MNLVKVYGIASGACALRAYHKATKKNSDVILRGKSWSEWPIQDKFSFVAGSSVAGPILFPGFLLTALVLKGMAAAGSSSAKKALNTMATTVGQARKDIAAEHNEVQQFVDRWETAADETEITSEDVESEFFDMLRELGLVE